MTKNLDDNDHKPHRGSRSYEVGYGKPPKATQFRRGESGNPRGRPRRRPSLAEAVRQQLYRFVSVRGEPGKKVLGMDALVQNLTALAIQGNMTALRLLLDVLKTLPPDEEAVPKIVTLRRTFVNPDGSICLESDLDSD